jgi:hypothetical protein
LTDGPQPIWQELAIPSAEERRLYEEWVRQREEEEKQREQRENERVIVIDI